MAGLADFRAQNPEYNDLPDNVLADKLYQKFYSDMPRADFNAKMFNASARQETTAQGAEYGPKNEPYQSGILPMRVDEMGQHSFDSNAGLLGMAKRVVTAPGDALAGKFDPMSKEGIGRALEMASVISPVSTATRAGEMAIPGVKTAHTVAKTKIPTAAELKAAKDAAYNSVENSGVEYSGQAIQNAIRELKGALTEKAAIAENYPKTFNLINKLDDAPEGSGVQLKFLDALRKQLGEVAGGDESFAARMAIKKLDDFIDAADPSSLMVRGSAAPAGGSANVPRIGGAPGPTPEDIAKQAAQTIRDARGNAAAGFRSDAITGVENAADLRAAAANSGNNIGNSIRQRLASLDLKDGGTRGFSPEEVARLESIIRGTPGMNAARDIGNKLAGGGGAAQTALATIGASAGGAVGGVPGAIMGGSLPYTVGAGSRAIYNNMTKSQIGALDDLMRMRSPLYQQRAANPQMEVLTPEMKAAIARIFGAGVLSPRPWNPKPNEA